MFYEPGKTPHGLPHDPFKACVVPRPIGWISTIGKDGKPNLAPYSQFQNLSFDPPYVMFSANNDPTPARAGQAQQKDTAYNAEQTGEFVWNMATYELREAVNESAAAHGVGVDEFKEAGLETVPSSVVRPPRVKRSPVQFECRVHHSFRLPGRSTTGTVNVVIGQVVGVHIADEFITPEGKLDILKCRPIARCGYYDFTSITEFFQMKIRDIPGSGIAINEGLEGSADKTSAFYANGSTTDDVDDVHGLKKE